MHSNVYTKPTVVVPHSCIVTTEKTAKEIVGREI